MREVGDVIAFDQRGTGGSGGDTNCTEKFTLPSDAPLTGEKVLDIYRKVGKACRDRLVANGVDLAGYNTNENADDLEDLRKALGVRKISLWGISYGTHLSFDVGLEKIDGSWKYQTATYSHVR